jgi:cell division protein FtsB
MKINYTEKQFLFGQKLREGKDGYLADYEIERDNCFMENIKYDNKSLKKENTKLKNEIKDLNNRLKKFIVPKEKEDLTTKKINNKDRTCQVKHLVRIINYLKDNPQSNITSIKNNCLIIEFCKEGVSFLTKYNIVKESKIKGVSLYSLK